MAVSATLETLYGENRKLYVRLNNFDQLANHGVPAVARFRGFLSKTAFDAGKPFVWEHCIEFPANAPTDPWTEAYDALKALPEFEGAVDA